MKKKENKEMPKIRRSRSSTSWLGFQLIICLSFTIILIINGLLVGNYWGKMRNWLLLIFEAQKGPYFSFVFFGAAFILLIVMIAAIMDARRQAARQAEIEKAQLLKERQHAEEIEKLNQELRLVNEQLEERNKLLSELDQLRLDIIGAMQHDLNHILAVIEAGAESLLFFLEEGDLNSKDNHTREQTPIILRDMKDATMQLASIVKETFDQAKTQVGEKIVIKKEKLNLAELVNSVLRWKKNVLTFKNIKTEIQFPGEMKINADPIGLLRVFTNLIDNAVKYSPKETRITIKAELTNDKFYCQVIDQGIGIPPDYLQEIFKMHSKVKSESADKITEEGRHGIGLFSCQNIIEAHGGKIWAESEGEGKGSTFSFILPIK